MAALNFPDSPNVNDVFTVGPREWIWDGSAWVSNSGREYTRLISDTAPSNPIEGDEWFNSSTGKLYIYYDSYWLEVGASVSGQDGADATLTRTIRSESANTALVSGDANQVIRFTGTSTQTLTVDDVLSVGDRVEVIQDNSGQVVFSSGSGVTLLSTTGGFSSSGQNAKIELMCVAAGEYRLFGDLAAVVPELEYLVIAGGGGGGGRVGGGGGAGGYRCSVSGESSGGGASAETAFNFDAGSSYTISIGAGGAGGTGANDASAQGSSGSNSSFSGITSLGGGGGGGANQSSAPANNGLNGGSGGGAGRDGGLPGSGTSDQGFNGGQFQGDGSATGGGGGAGSVGDSGVLDVSGDGGDGVQSSITGTAVNRAGGGGGAGGIAAIGAGLGKDGGGDGGNETNGSPGTASTGGGGGAGGYSVGTATTYAGAAGGSGVVILRYPSAYSITIGAGLTGTTSTVGANKVTEITAGTGNISFS